MNGIGGSGDFARNARSTIFVTKSLAKSGESSVIVPMVTHVDHTNTTSTSGDRESAWPICAAWRRANGAQDHRELRPSAVSRPAGRLFCAGVAARGHTPHLLEEAFSWHLEHMRYGSMRSPDVVYERLASLR